MLSNYIDTDRYKVFDRTEQKSKVNEFLALLRTEEIQSFLKVFIDSAIATSELKILKRLATCEALLGLDDYSIDEEHAPTIPERINLISEKIEKLTISPQNETRQEVIIPRTSLESKAVKLVDKLKLKPCSRTGEVFMDNSELTTFLQTELPEELRSNDTNIRRVKKRVIEKARSLFPESVSVNKSKYGRHETRVIFKFSPETVPLKRNGTLNLNLS